MPYVTYYRFYIALRKVHILFQNYAKALDYKQPSDKCLFSFLVAFIGNLFASAADAIKSFLIYNIVLSLLQTSINVAETATTIYTASPPPSPPL